MQSILVLMSLAEQVALAFDCADVVALVAAGVSPEQIVRAVEARGPLPADFAACAEARGIPPGLVSRLTRTTPDAAADTPSAVPPPIEFLLQPGKTVTLTTRTRLGPGVTKRTAVDNPESQVRVVKSVMTGANVLGDSITS